MSKIIQAKTEINGVTIVICDCYKWELYYNFYDFIKANYPDLLDAFHQGDSWVEITKENEPSPYFVRMETLENHEKNSIPIGDIGNEYGGLYVRENKYNNKYYWGIENHSGTGWSQIPKYLFDALMQYESTRDKTEDENS